MARKNGVRVWAKGAVQDAKYAVQDKLIDAKSAVKDAGKAVQSKMQSAGEKAARKIQESPINPFDKAAKGLKGKK
jgi:hypothetical protein